MLGLNKTSNTFYVQEFEQKPVPVLFGFINNTLPNPIISDYLILVSVFSCIIWKMTICIWKKTLFHCIIFFSPSVQWCPIVRPSLIYMLAGLILILISPSRALYTFMRQSRLSPIFEILIWTYMGTIVKSEKLTKYPRSPSYPHPHICTAMSDTSL